MSSDNNIIVSVCCATYNHENYIRQCLEGFVIQQTTFPFEILIHEDASTDNTAGIVKEFEAKYPHLFRCVYQTVNQFAIQNTLTNILFPMSRGKYIALCEGDDYWTDPNKLQRQVDFLEANKEFSISTHNVLSKLYDAAGNLLNELEWFGKNHKEIYTINDLLMYGSGGATCSMVFRRVALDPLPEAFNFLKGGDWPLQIFCATKGKMKYFTDAMGVYRRNPSGLIASTRTITIFKDFGTDTCKYLNRYFNYKYNREISYQLYHYFYPNLADAYYKNKNLFLYILIRLKRFILKLQYRF